MKKTSDWITGNERPFPDDPDAKWVMRRLVLLKVKEAGGIPLICQLRVTWPNTICRWLISSSLLVVKMSLPKFYGEEITIDSDDYLLKRDLLSWPWLRKRAAKKAILTVFGTQPTMLHWGGTSSRYWGSLAGQSRSVHQPRAGEPRIRRFYKRSMVRPVASILHHQSIKDLQMA